MANIEVSPEINKVLKQYADSRKCSTEEAAKRLITVAVGRLNALKTYAKKVAAEAPTKPAKAKKEPKAAKGPIARKAPKAKAAKVPKIRKPKAVGADVTAPVAATA